MNTVQVIVHRATNVIGGNCIELRASCGARVLLDVGRPLDAPKAAVGLLPSTLDLNSPVEAILISHPHQDHYGLLNEVPEAWPVFCGQASAVLMRLTSEIAGTALTRNLRSWKSGVPISTGPFIVTPYLTDHSAFDAHMLVIECYGKRLLYSGDFRFHGRKGSLVEKMMNAPPASIDVLLMEGTNLGSEKPCMTEVTLEQQFTSLFARTSGRVFVSWSAQNVDRTVTLYRAALKAGRTLVVDLYTASVLEALADFGRIPQPGWVGLKVVVTARFARLYRNRGNAAFVDRMAKHGIAARNLADSAEKWVIMTRPSLISDFEKSGVLPNASDSWSWSMWRGYLENSDGALVQAWFDSGGTEADHLHTSGHASPADLRAFAKSINPKTMIPIHGVSWDCEFEGFPNITRLADGQPLNLQ